MSNALASDPGGLRNATIFYSTPNQISETNGNYVELVINQSPKIIVKKTPEYVKHSEAGINQILKRKKIPLSNEKTGFTKPPTAYPNPPKTNTTQSSCTTVDLAPQMGPVRDQFAFNCWAYAATDVLTFNQPGGPYSPGFLSTMMEGKKSYNSEKPILSVAGFDGQYVNDAMTQGVKDGMCPESLVNSEDSYFKDYVRIIQYYETKRKKQIAFDDLCEKEADGDFFWNWVSGEKENLDRIKDKYRAYYDLWKTDDVKEAVLSIYPKMNATRVQEIFEQSPDLTTFFKSMSLEACKNQIKKIPPNVGPQNVKKTSARVFIGGEEFVFDDARVKMVDDINSTLSKGKPLALGFRTNGLIKNSDPELHGNHASTIAGRRWRPGEKGKPGECIYLIKNSWGKDWKIPAGVKANPSKYPGYFEVTETQLLEHAYDISYLD